jgi:4-amino-4-deoxy-L-arabinose transferase-like glycosyltransferase
VKAAADRSLALLLVGWAAFAIASLWLRPLWPVDETRYVSVAWEMWQRGDFLVPWVNGEAYSQKPPLLFWLMQLGWAVFGVNEWWPRLVGPLCAFGALPVLFKLEALLWNEERNADHRSAWILFGTVLFAAFVTLTMFDLLLLLCVMAGMVGVLELAQGARRRGLLWLGAGIGLGVLAKGPVVLLHVLPAAVIAPWWWAPHVRNNSAGKLSRWYLDLVLGTLIGAAIALAWALPAAYEGGEAYRRAIFWGQTAGRVSESFAHRAPVWYDLPLLPLILFPWFVWPRFWQGVKKSWSGSHNSDRFLLAWLVLTLVGFSLVSGKQAKYLVPVLPAFALLAARAIECVKGTSTPGTSSPARRAWVMLPPVAGFLALPAGLLWIRAHPGQLGLPAWSSDIPVWPIALLALAAPALMLFARKDDSTQVRALAFGTLVAFAVAGAGVLPAFAPYGDTMPAAQYLAAQQRLKVPLAHLGKYHAQYNFTGRLREPIAILEARELRGWAAAHPAGQVITVERKPAAAAAAQPEYQGPFRGAWIQVWRAENLLQARPELR